MKDSKEIFEEYYEDLWRRERLFIDYQKELEYEQLKQELGIFINKGKSYNTAKKANFVNKISSHGIKRNRVRNRRKTKKR